VIRPIAALGVLALAVTACGGDGAPAAKPADVPINDSLCLDAPRAGEPVVGLIDDAIARVEAEYGAPQAYFEISADRQRVSVIVATDAGTAEHSFYCGAAGFVPPSDLGDADGARFTAESIDVDALHVFDGIVEELGDPDIVDFAIVGAGDGSAIYDATVQSESGGVLMVLLTGSGDVLGVQAQ